MPWHWIGFFVLVLILVALDLGVFHRDAHSIRTREAVGWTIFWIALGLLFSGAVYLLYENHWFDMGQTDSHSGMDAVWLYLTGYLVEKSLSIDNIFVISLIFRSMRVPDKFQHRVLFWGILGALVFRGIMIAGGVYLIHKFTWTFYVFGGVLVLSGIKMLFEKEDPEQVKESWFLQVAKRVLPLAKQRHEGHFIAREDGRFVFTSLAVALIAIELTDIIFAVDSVPAVLGITTDPFLVVTSNVFAILGLRSLYFVLASMMSKFAYLKYALALLLVLIGAKLFAHNILHVPNWASLSAVVVVVGGGILISLAHAAREPKPAAVAESAVVEDGGPDREQ